MTTRLTRVTRKGQTTIPEDIRRALGVKEGDRVAWTLENGQARLAPYEGFAARTAGILRVEGPPLSAEQLREAAAQAMADIAVERSGR